jgi:hypothetical protein
MSAIIPYFDGLHSIKAAKAAFMRGIPALLGAGEELVGLVGRFDLRGARGRAEQAGDFRSQVFQGNKRAEAELVFNRLQHQFAFEFVGEANGLVQVFHAVLHLN